MRATAGLRAARGRPRQVRHQGRQALHRRVVRGLARLEADRRGGEPVLRQVRRARHQEHPRPQGPDDLAAGQGRLRRLRRRSRRDGLQRRAQLHRRARRPAADRGLLLHGDAGAQRLRRPRRGRRRPDARPPEVLRQGHGRAAVLGRRGQDAVRLRLRDLGAEVADRGLRRLGDARRRRPTRTSRAWTSSGKRKILGLNAAKLYGVEVPAELRGERPGRRAGLRRKRSGRRHERSVPESSKRSGRSTTRSSTSRSPRSASSAPWS